MAPVDVTELPPPLVAKAMAAPADQQPGILTALTTLTRAGFFWHYTWTPPIEGTPVDHYHAMAEYDVTDNNVWVLNVDKSNYTMRVAGVDSVPRMGPYSAHSDTMAAEVWQ